MSRIRLEPRFVDSSVGRLFVLLRAPEGATRCVLFVPPFGEEMNKSRRQVTEAADALIAEGYAVLVVDLYGTGDSEGEFGDARWEHWKSDIARAMTWIDENDLSLHAIVATRLGCILAGESLRQAGTTVSQTVFWQPVASGKLFISQILRLRVAASMMESGDRETVQTLRQRLNEGGMLKIAGYELSLDLCNAIEAVELSVCLAPCLGKLAIFEVGRSSNGDLSVAGKRLAASAAESGVEAIGEGVSGEPFWTSTEIVTNAELTRCTVDFLTAAKQA